jgi:hypothetical protein
MVSQCGATFANLARDQPGQTHARIQRQTREGHLEIERFVRERNVRRARAFDPSHQGL